MTVREFVALLQGFPPESAVVIDFNDEEFDCNFDEDNVKVEDDGALTVLYL